MNVSASPPLPPSHSRNGAPAAGAVAVTKTRILDAAEKLFGQKGFDATSLRDITTEAQVNLAAVNYHFQSKDSLIDAVIERRIRPVNQQRMEMLRTAGTGASVEQIVEAYLCPLLKMEALPAVPLIGRALSNPDQFFERVYKRHMQEVAEGFAEAIGRARPALPRKECLWRLQFMAGSMSHVLALSAALPRMMGNPGQPLDRVALIRRLTEFLSAGLCAPYSGAAAARKTARKAVAKPMKRATSRGREKE